MRCCKVLYVQASCDLFLMSHAVRRPWQQFRAVSNVCVHCLYDAVAVDMELKERIQEHNPDHPHCGVGGGDGCPAAAADGLFVW